MKLNILACQINIPPMTSVGQKIQHVNRIVELIEVKLARTTVDLIVLPELSNIDYSRETFDQLDSFAEGFDGPTCKAFSTLAKKHKAHIVFGMASKRNGAYFITQVIFDDDGNYVGHYDKLHIAQFGASMEKEYFEPGKQILVFNVKGIRVSPIICYDIRIPELFRTLCIDHQVQLVLHCGAFYRDESFYSWQSFAITRAMENLTYLLSLNRAGEFYGGSLLCPPWVDDDQPETMFPMTETLKILEIDSKVIQEMRDKYTFLEDRLDDYSSLEIVTK